MLTGWFKLLNIMKRNDNSQTKGNDEMKRKLGKVDWTKELAKIGIKAGIVYVGNKTLTPKQAANHVRLTLASTGS